MRIKSTEMKGWEKLLVFMADGKPVNKADIEKALGKQIEMYRISCYLVECKIHAKAIIKSTRIGRKIDTYQIINPEAMNIVVEKIHKRIADAKIASAPVAKIKKNVKPVKKVAKKPTKIKKIADLGITQKTEKQEESLTVEEIK
jgi:hypothetical protein